MSAAVVASTKLKYVTCTGILPENLSWLLRSVTMSGRGKSNSDQKKSVTEPSKTVVLKLRLFVGGLGPTVGSIDLQQRFAPLGTVHRIDLVDGKKGWDAEEALQRGFAYVDFEASSEASLQKLFSAYNGCKWKGGVLRVEKAKEHYMDRLRREWAEAEVEAAAKAKIAEEAAAEATTEFRPMYSYKSEGLSGSLDFNRVDLDNEGDGIAMDADVIAAQIEKERKTHLDLLSKLFPEDKDTGDEEEKIVEIVKLRAFPLPTDVNAKKRKHALETPSVPVVDATVVQPSTHESDTVDENNKQSSKSRRVKFSEASDARPNDEMAGDAAKVVRPILKKTLMDADKNEEGQEDDEEEEEYYPSSRSPSPEGGLSDESKWERLYKYAGLKKEREAPKPSSTLSSGPTVWTGISLDDDDTEAAEAPEPLVNDGTFSGVLSEQEDEESDPPQAKSIGVDGVGGDSDVDEETDSPEAMIFGNGVHDSKESAKLTKEPEASSETLPDEDEESSDGIDEPESSDSESDDEEDGDEDMEDFVDAAPVVESPLGEAAKASKWAKMFKSATSAAEPVEGVFSGSLDEADVPIRPRPAVKAPRMFESASANHTEAPKVSADIVTSGAMEDGSRRASVEENPSTSSEEILNQSDIKEEEDDKQNGDTRSNLLSLFNVEQNEPQACGNDHGHGVSSSLPVPEGQNAVDDNTKWIQRATWKSLMGADGRATFSLKQLTGESETTKAAEVKKIDSVPKHSFSAFSFNFVHNAAPESKRESVHIEQRAEKVPESGEKQTKAAAAKAPEDEGGCSFMKSTDAEKEWRASRGQLRMDSRAKHKAAVRKMKKMKGSGGAR